MENNTVRARLNIFSTSSKNIQPSQELRKFGFSLGLGLNILGYIMFYRHKGHFIWFSVIGSGALVSAIAYPKVLAPLKKLLDKLIFIIGWFASIVSLSIVFYLIFALLGVLLKILSKDLLSEKIDKETSSYWIKRKNIIFSKESYERMG